jgi:hypothetical protein
MEGDLHVAPITSVERERREALFARGLKECSSPDCVVPYPLEWFAPNNRSYRGLSSRCIPCRNEATLEYQKRHPAKLAARVRTWQRENPERSHGIAKRYRDSKPWQGRLRGGKTRAAALGLPADDITLEELLADFARRGVDPTVDAFTGEPLVDGWHIDHLVPLSHPQSPGHVVWNLLPVNAGTNQLKWQRSWFDFLADRAEAAKRGEVA